MTSDDYLTEIRHTADAESDIRWPTARIQTLMDMVFRREWQNILNANPRYNFAEVTVTTDANGRFPISALTTGSGDSQQVFYRIIEIIVGGCRVYSQMDFRDAPLLSTGVGQAFAYYGWYRIGDEIQLAPVEQNLTVIVFVSWLPQKPSTLSATSVEVAFPDSYEMVPIWETAGLLMAKGGLEPDAMQALRQQAELMRQDLLATITRISNDPTQIKYSDSRGDWAGLFMPFLGAAAMFGHHLARVLG